MLFEIFYPEHKAFTLEELSDFFDDSDAQEVLTQVVNLEEI